jgi:hypothetical protein
MSNFDYTGTLPTYEDERQGDGLVRVQWLNGDIKARTGGRFFVAADRLPDGFTPGAPWAAHTEVFDNGDESEGFRADALNLIALCARRQIYKSEGDGKRAVKIWMPKNYRWIKGDTAQRMHVSLLCIMQGLEDLGPVVWSTNATKTSFAMLAILDGVKEAIKPAVKSAGKPLPTFGFWLPVASEKDAKGKVKYTETPGKHVTLPVLGWGADVALEVLQEHWVGGAYLSDTLIPMRDEYEVWRQTYQTNGGTEDAAGYFEAQPAAPRRNVPQPAEDDEDLRVVYEEPAPVPAPRATPPRRKAF